GPPPLEFFCSCSWFLRSCLIGHAGSCEHRALDFSISFTTCHQLEPPQIFQVQGISMPRPFSQACENNKQPILDVLLTTLPSQGLVLEVGSGTAQHVLHFAAALPALTWLPSEMPNNLTTVLAGLEGLAPANVLAPIALDAHQV